MTGPSVITVQDTALHVRSDGPVDGPVLVFSNSLGTDFRVWDAVMPLLPPGLRVIRYDKRGHGLSDCPPGDWGMAAHVADLAGLLDALGVRGAVVCGLSVGGLIAQGLAAARPDLVRALILSNTAARIGGPAMWDERITALRAGGLAVLAEAILQRWFTPRFRAEEPSLAIWRNMLVRTPIAGYIATCLAIRDTDFTAQTAGLRLPVLAIGGEHDGSTPPDLVAATAALVRGARFELVADAGHIPGVEQPQIVAGLIAGFLAEIGHV